MTRRRRYRDSFDVHATLDTDTPGTIVQPDRLTVPDRWSGVIEWNPERWRTSNSNTVGALPGWAYGGQALGCDCLLWHPVLTVTATVPGRPARGIGAGVAPPAVHGTLFEAQAAGGPLLHNPHNDPTFMLAGDDLATMAVDDPCPFRRAAAARHPDCPPYARSYAALRGDLG